MSFRLLDVLFAVALIAIVTGWVVDRNRLESSNFNERQTLKILRCELSGIGAEEFDTPIGLPISQSAQQLEVIPWDPTFLSLGLENREQATVRTVIQYWDCRDSFPKVDERLVPFLPDLYGILDPDFCLNSFRAKVLSNKLDTGVVVDSKHISHDHFRRFIEDCMDTGEVRH